MNKPRKKENGEKVNVVKTQATTCPYVNFPEGTILARFTMLESESLDFERFCASSCRSYCILSIFKIPASGTGFWNTSFLPASAKLAAKYRPGWCNTGHLAILDGPGTW